MILKINKYTFNNITNKDWVLDNGACIQCMTLKHRGTDGSRYRLIKEYPTIMSQKQFKQLVKQGKLVYSKELSDKFYPGETGWCKVYKFNVTENDNER